MNTHICIVAVSEPGIEYIEHEKNNRRGGCADHTSSKFAVFQNQYICTYTALWIFIDLFIEICMYYLYVIIYLHYTYKGPQKMILYLAPWILAKLLAEANARVAENQSDDDKSM